MCIAYLLERLHNCTQETTSRTIHTDINIMKSTTYIVRAPTSCAAWRFDLVAEKRASDFLRDLLANIQIHHHAVITAAVVHFLGLRCVKQAHTRGCGLVVFRA